MKILIVATLALLLAACAAMTPTTDQPVAEQKTYSTGSHLPSKDKNGSSTINSSAPQQGAPPPAYVPGKGQPSG
jgi:hypothetical protein